MCLCVHMYVHTQTHGGHRIMCRGGSLLPCKCQVTCKLKCLPCQEAFLPFKPSSWPHNFIVLLGKHFICSVPILFTPFQEFSSCTLSNNLSSLILYLTHRLALTISYKCTLKTCHCHIPPPSHPCPLLTRPHKSLSPILVY